MTTHDALAIMRDLERLFAQLSADAMRPQIHQVQFSLLSPTTVVLGAFENSRLVGTATLIVAPLLNKSIGFIESVVVDEAVRGKGIGLRLMQEILGFAKKRNLVACNLTSTPDRTEANRLYRELGFVQRETNLYRYTF